MSVCRNTVKPQRKQIFFYHILVGGILSYSEPPSSRGDSTSDAAANKEPRYVIALSSTLNHAFLSCRTGKHTIGEGAYFHNVIRVYKACIRARFDANSKQLINLVQSSHRESYF